MADSSNPQAIQEEENALDEYIRLTNFEETFLKEKSRIKWMKEGDKNFSFFHRSVKAHTARNKILRLQYDDGIWTKDYEEVQILTVFNPFSLSQTNKTNVVCLISRVFEKCKW